MEKDMLEQIQQMITTANESLRQNLRQDMAALESRLSERIEGIEQAQRGTESRLGERIDETKRHSGVLVEGLRHELQLVAEGIQMHIERRHREDRDHVDQRFQEHRVLMQTSYSQLNDRMERHEQSHHT